MAELLLIRIPDTGVDRAEWAVLDENGNISSEVMHTGLAEAADYAGGRRVTVITSGQDVVLMEAEVPTGNAAQAKRAIPFSLEDSLAEDVDDLHFAIGEQTQNKRYPVAVISRQQMDKLKKQCDDAGLHPTTVVPEPLAVPLLEKGPQQPWSAILANGRTILRQRDFLGFSVDTRDFAPMLDRALQEAIEDAPPKLNLYTVGEAHQPSLSIATSCTNCAHALEVMARGINAPSINLLQGDYSHRQQLGKLLRPWKMTSVLIALLLVIWSGSSVEKYVRLGQRETMLDRQMQMVLKNTIPGARDTRDPVKRMKMELKEIRQGNNDFLSIISEISSAIRADKKLSPRSINYRDGRVEIELDAAQLELFDAMKKRIEAGGRLTATIQSTSKENDHVRGRVRIRVKK